MISSEQIYVVFGATGCLGSTISSELAKFPGNTVIGACRNPSHGQIKFDLGAMKSWSMPKKINYGIIAASYSDRRGCERNQFESQMLNVTNTIHLAKSITEKGGKVVYFSTNLVFDGSKQSFMPSDSVNPFDLYGQQKSDVEAYLVKEVPSALILRLTKVLHNNLPIFQIWRNQAAGGNPIKVFTNVSISPISPSFAAKATIKLINQGTAGLVHLSGDCSVSYASIYEKFKRDLALEFAPFEMVEDTRPLRFGTLGVPVSALVQPEDSMQVLSQLNKVCAN